MSDRRRHTVQIVIIVGVVWIAIAVGVIGWVTWEPLRHFPRSGMTAGTAVAQVAFGEGSPLEDTTTTSFFDQVASATAKTKRDALTTQQAITVLNALHNKIYTAETLNYTPLTWSYHSQHYNPVDREHTSSDPTQDTAYACRYLDDAGGYECQETINFTTPEAASYLATLTITQYSGEPESSITLTVVPIAT